MNSWSSVPVDLGQLGLSRVINWVRFSSSWVRSGRVNLCNFNFSRVGVIEPGLMHVPYTDICSAMCGVLMLIDVWYAINAATWLGSPFSCLFSLMKLCLPHPPSTTKDNTHTHKHTQSHISLCLAAAKVSHIWSCCCCCNAAQKWPKWPNRQMNLVAFVRFEVLLFIGHSTGKQTGKQTDRQTGAVADTTTTTSRKATGKCARLFYTRYST